LGNDSGVTTTVELKNDLEVTKEYRDLAVLIKKHEAAVAALELHIGPYLNSRKRVPLLKKEFRVKITGLLEKYDGVVSSLERLRQQERKMRESKQAQTDARIVVSGVAYAGTVFTLGEARLELKDNVQGPVSFRCPDRNSEWIVEKVQGVKKG